MTVKLRRREILRPHHRGRRIRLLLTALPLLLPPLGAGAGQLPRHAPTAADIENREWRMGPPAEQLSFWPHRGISYRIAPYLAFMNGQLGGSPGCGTFAGTYRRLGDELTFSAQWHDNEKSPCDSDDKLDAAQAMKWLAAVRSIHTEPAYWQDDALLLNDAHGVTTINLSPMKTGEDLSEVEDTLWQLTKLDTSSADLSKVIVEIQQGDNAFILPSSGISFAYEYELRGLKFPPAAGNVAAINRTKSAEQRGIMKAIDNDLQRFASYEIATGILTFRDKEGHTLIAHTPMRPRGIEYRLWRIAKYRDNAAHETDVDGLAIAKARAEILLMNGGLYGGPGCGGWSGSYSIVGDTLQIETGQILAGLCFSPEQSQTDLVVKALQGDLKIEQRNDYVLLRNKSGQAQIELVPLKE